MDENIENNLKLIKNDLDIWKQELLEKRGARDQLKKVYDEEFEILVSQKEEQELSQKAQLFLLSEISEKRNKAIQSIENIGTSALKTIYGRDYRIRFETYDDKRKEGSSNFKMDIQVISKINGKELITGLMDCRGGGVVEIISFALRIAALNWKGYKGPILLDEAYKSISNDYKLESVAEFIKSVAIETNQQFIFATHKADVFGKIADNIIQVDRINGIAKCSIVDSDTE